MNPRNSRRKMLVVLLIIAAVVAVLAWYGWTHLQQQGPGEGFVSGNGRIEATEVDVATRIGGRVDDIFVHEGDFVHAGQVLARMQIDSLQAQYDEALAREQEAQQGVSAAKAQIAQRRSDVVAQQAAVSQRQAERDAVRQRLNRSEALAKSGAVSRQALDDDRAYMRSAEAALEVAQAQVVALEAAVTAAQAQLTAAESRVLATQASVARLKADLDDADLKAPRDGRVQFLVAQPGEVLGAGGRVLNLIDLTDVYMTFFLPETVVGRVALGSEVRIVLDAAPQYPVPATISFVASNAQFTPKTVETASERQKLMFRVRAKVSPELLRQYIEQVKTGLPGVAWVKLDADAPWPAALTTALAE